MDELPPHAKSFLSSVRESHEPPRGAAARVRARLGAAAFGAPGVQGTPRTGGLTAMPRSSIGKAAKVALAGGVIAMLGTAGLLLRNETRKTAAHPAAPSVSVSVAALASLSAAPRVVEPIAPSETRAAPGERSSDSAAPAVRSVSRPARLRHAAAISSGGNLLQGELNLLSAASDALLVQDLDRAHELLELHRVRYPHGQLREERTGLDLLRRCLADEPEAGARAQLYLRVAPHGMLTARIQHACEVESSRR
jgi:hypothetical protein